MLIIQRPTVEAVDEEEDNRQRFAIGPLDPGFGHTLGNSLRRTLLSSIPGAAVTQVRFDEALHEFTTLHGVKEDVTDIILNLKDLLVRVDGRRAGDPAHRQARPRRRHGGRPADHRRRRGPQPRPAPRHRERQGPPGHRRHRRAGQGLRLGRQATSGRRPSGSSRSTRSSRPVRRVTFDVEPVRVEQSTDFDRLVLDIETDGSITPREALASAGDTLRTLVGLVADLEDAPQGLELGETARTTGGSPDLDLRIEDLDLSERPRNCLKRAQINTIGELVERTVDDLLGDHQLRSEVPRRGDPAPRRARPVAADQGLRTDAGHPASGAAASAATPPTKRRCSATWSPR